MSRVRGAGRAGWGRARPPREADPGTVVPQVRRDPATGRTGPEGPYEAVQDVLHSGGPHIVFQPQLSLSRLEVAGYEALARFPGEPMSGDPEHWFLLAHDVGLGPALEASAVTNALARGAARPSGTTLAVNLSPSVLSSPAMLAALPGDLSGIELELTEHEAVVDPAGLRRDLDRMRERGARLAIDDVGAGHSGLRRIMDLAPDCLKLDRHLVDGVADDTAKSALVRAVVDFADHIGASVCAEGVERVEDLLALADLDVDFAQGWTVGTPEPTCRDADPLVVAACERSLHRVLKGSRGAVPAWSTWSMAGATIERTGAGPSSVEDLLGWLAEIRDLDDLARLVRACSTVLNCAKTELSYLRDGSTAVEAVVAAAWRGEGDVYRLSDYPATDACLRERRVIPVYRMAGGDPAELRLLDELGFASVLLVPVSGQGRPVGLLECYLNEPTQWSRRQIRAAWLLSAVLGPVLAGLMPG